MTVFSQLTHVSQEFNCSHCRERETAKGKSALQLKLILIQIIYFFIIFLIQTSHDLFLQFCINFGILCAFTSSYILAMISAIYNFVYSHVFRKERLDNQQAST